MIRALCASSDSFFNAFMKPSRTHGTPEKAVVFVEIAVSKVVHRDSETCSWQHLGSKKEPR